jgi:hypothetical protein
MQHLFSRPSQQASSICFIKPDTLWTIWFADVTLIKGIISQTLSDCMGTGKQSCGCDANRPWLHRNPINDASHDFLLPAIVKPGRPWVSMAHKALHFLERDALAEQVRYRADSE